MFSELESQINDYVLDCDIRGLSNRTLHSYQQSLLLFARYLSDVHEITDAKDVKTEHIKRYIKYCKDRGKYSAVTADYTKQYNRPEARPDHGKPVSVSTVANYLRNIKVFFGYLEKERIIRINPAKGIKSIKPERKEKKLLSKEELRRLMQSFDLTRIYEMRAYIMTRLILDTGVRVGELTEIKPEDIDFRNRAILMRVTKNGSERYVFFSNKMSRELKRWLQYQDRYSTSEYLFSTSRNTQMTVSSFERTLRIHGEKAGVKVTPHILRNNFAKYYLMNGGDLTTLSRLLGHSSLEVTKVYLDFTTDEIRDQYQKFSPMNNLKI